jgi:hypothetical protein
MIMCSNCALCLKEEPLRNSHIAPEFLYENMHDEKHHFHVVSLEDEHAAYAQKGIHENLLCQS